MPPTIDVEAQGQEGTLPPLVARSRIMGGSWYLEPSEADWDNVVASRVKLMVIGFDVCRTAPSILDALRHLDIEVIVRLRDDEFWGMPVDDALGVLTTLIGRGHVVGVIPCTEADNGFRPDWHSPNWGNRPSDDFPHGKSWDYRLRMHSFIDAYNGEFPLVPEGEPPHQRWVRRGPTLYAPPWTAYCTNGAASPWPGQVDWQRITHDAHGRCDKGTAHVYTDNYLSPGDLERLETGAQVAASLSARWPVLIDEIGVVAGKAAAREGERVSAYIDFCRRIHEPVHLRPGALGTIVEGVVPFCFNGDPSGTHWPASYRLTQPESYRRIGRFLSEGQ